MKVARKKKTRRHQQGTKYLSKIINYIPQLEYNNLLINIGKELEISHIERDTTFAYLRYLRSTCDKKRISLLFRVQNISAIYVQEFLSVAYYIATEKQRKMSIK